MNFVLIKKGALAVLLIYVFILALLNIQVDHYNFEGGLYKFRYHSITQDHDFNLINNNENKFNDVVTPTDNIADMHDIGAPIFWSFIYDWYHTFFPELAPLKLRKTAYIMDDELITSSFHLILLILIFTLLYKRQLIGRDKWSLPVLMAFALGVHDYTFDQFFTADIMALFIMGLLTIHLGQTDLKKKENIYTMALLFGVLRVIKISSILYAPALILFLFIRRESLKTFSYNLIRFLITYGIFIILTELNFYTNIGSWSFLQGYDYAYSIDFLTNLHGWKATYFYPRGLLLHTPILLFSVYPISLLLLKIADEKSFNGIDNNLLISFLFGVVMLIKLSLGLFSITAHYLGLGARQFFIDFVPLCFIFQFLWQRSKKIALCLLLGSCISLLFYTFSWYALEKDYELFTLTPTLNYQQWFHALLDFFNGLMPFLKRFSISLVNHIDLLGLITFLVIVLSYFYSLFINSSRRIYTASILSLIILAYSVLNLVNNDKNTSSYISNRGYSHYILGKGGPLYLHHEIISGLSLAKAYEAQYGTNNSQLYLKNLSSSLKKDIFKDIAFIGSQFDKDELKSELIEDGKIPMESIELNQNK